MQMNIKKYITLSIITLGAFILDQVSKWFVSKNIDFNEIITVIPNYLYLTYEENRLLISSTWTSQSWYPWLVAFIWLIFIAAFVHWVYRVYKNIDKFNVLMMIYEGLLVAGISSNAFDRGFKGYEINFIVGDGMFLESPFNLAHLFFNIGALLSLVSYFHKKWKR